MNLKSVFAGTVALSAIAYGAVAPANAQAGPASISAGQWYTGAFSTTGTAVYGPGGSLGTNGPLPGGGRAGAIFAPTGTAWSVTLATPGYLVVTDVEEAGDQFQVFVNGVGGTPTTNNLSPSGAAGLAGGDTSVPCYECVPNIGENIAVALAAGSGYSNGTFYLPAGTDTINMTFLGSVGFGDMDFLASTSAVPLPASWTMLLAGFAGLGFFAYRGSKKNSTALSAA
jgi:hypothetical protein